MIRITSKQDGFRRCGIAHSKSVVEHPDNTFTPEQVAILQAEPVLTVEIIDSGNNTPNRPNAKDSIAAIQALATIEELDVLAEGEDRKSVLDAIAKRRAELEAPKE